MSVLPSCGPCAAMVTRFQDGASSTNGSGCGAPSFCEFSWGNAQSEVKKSSSCVHTYTTAAHVLSAREPTMVPKTMDEPKPAMNSRPMSLRSKP